MAISDGKDIKVHKGMGLVSEVFNKHILSELNGGVAAVGHVRYSTTGTSSLANAQPLAFRYLWGTAAFAHNGNLTNAGQLAGNWRKKELSFNQPVTPRCFQLTGKCSEKEIVAALKKSVSYIRGAYAMVIMTRDKLIGIRDPHGVRPLCLGRLDEAYILASENLCPGNGRCQVRTVYRARRNGGHR